MIVFRPMQPEDLELMYRWLNDDPVIREIWTQGEGRTRERIAAKYGPRLAGTDPTRSYIILCDGVPIGYTQWYLWRDYPGYAAHLGLEEVAASVDLFIGEAAYRYRGLGGGIIRQLLRDVVFAHPDPVSCVITPIEGNDIAIRAYEKAGYRHVRTLYGVPGEPGPVYLMRVGREEVVAADAE
ncbi:MAG: GNAT family N-acetyltransferase [Bacillota bacterium]|nr:GNAT family N-acetyltransferase [Bacillota bacterium]